jgi:hypothetical protein
MSCQTRADRLAESYRRGGVPFRLVWTDLSSADLLAGVPPTVWKTWGPEGGEDDPYCIVREFTVQEQERLQATAGDVRFRFAHPSEEDVPAEIYSILLEPMKESGILLYLPVERVLGDPPTDVSTSASYRFRAVLDKRMIGAPVAHTWHMARSGE